MCSRSWSTDATSTVQSVAIGDGDRLAATSNSGDLFIWDTSTPGAAPRQFPVFASDVVGGKVRFSTDLNAWIVGSQEGDLRVIGFDDTFTVGASATSLPMDIPFDTIRHGRQRPRYRREGDGERRRRGWPHRDVGPHRDTATRWPCVRRCTDRSAPGPPGGPLIAGGPEGVWQLDGVTGAIPRPPCDRSGDGDRPGRRMAGPSDSRRARCCGRRAPSTASRRSPRWRVPWPRSPARLGRRRGR